MAHAHRFLATHRAADGPIPLTSMGNWATDLKQGFGNDWSLYTPYVDPILSGELFTEAEGYVGPGAGVGPSFYPAPFPEYFYGAGDLHDLRWNLNAYNGSLDGELTAVIKHNAAAFAAEARANGWQDVRFFAYIMDEVTGPQDRGEARRGEGDIPAFHHAMAHIQYALDRGSEKNPAIDLIWTSHADASTWNGTPADLRPTIRWWVPNGHAVNLDFYRDIVAQPGQTVWFYHSGRPAIGNHSINQLGYDLRVWPLLCARYDLDGMFWWSMMNFAGRYDTEGFDPYAMPQYKTAETRWGNGVLFYPGSRLTTLGAHRNIAGPIPSQRMKAFRRGLQDFEYLWLARDRGHAEAANALLRELVPNGFSESTKWRQNWSENPARLQRLPCQTGRIDHSRQRLQLATPEFPMRCTVSDRSQHLLASLGGLAF